MSLQQDHIICPLGSLDSSSILPSDGLKLSRPNVYLSPNEKIDCFLMRHAESKYNEITKSCQCQINSKQAKALFQLDKSLIDCSITEKGIKEIQKMKLPEILKQPSFTIDIIFVSPMNRALETAKLLISHHQLKYKKIIVLPQLTEVISKICDFGSQLSAKIEKYGKQFDFSLMANDQKNKNGNVFWQDQFIDSSNNKLIDKKKNNGERYIKIIQQIFPTPLQSTERCLERSLRAIERMKTISQQFQAHRILAVTHNRILKNIFTKGKNVQQFHIMKNCEMRNHKL